MMDPEDREANTMSPRSRIKPSLKFLTLTPGPQRRDTLVRIRIRPRYRA